MRVLLDEMWPPEAAELLRNRHAIDALHVSEVGMGGAPDGLIAGYARRGAMVLVTENVRDFADEEDLTVVFVLKRRLQAGGAMAASLAGTLAGWAGGVPNPGPRAYWPHSG